MILFVLKVYEFIQILFLNGIKFLNFFTKNKKIGRFLVLRDSQQFLDIVAQTGVSFRALKAQNPNAKLFWFHVASAGELEQAIPLASVLHERLNAFFFVTYYSPSTEPFLKNFPWCLGSSGLPIDSFPVYQKAYKTLAFEKIFFVRYDLWPALVLFASHAHIELNLLCATRQKTTSGLRSILSEKWNFFLYKKFRNIFVTTQQDYIYFHKYLPQQQVVFAGDTKWRRALERAQAFRDIMLSPRGFTTGPTPQADAFIEFFCSVQNYLKENDLKCIVFGSPHKEEHEIALKLIELQNSLLVIYVPHDVSKKSCHLLYVQIQKRGGTPCFYSEITKEWSPWSSHGVTVASHGVTASSKGARGNCGVTIIVDEIGHLAEIYALANVAVIGGGFDGQIHNLLEACAHGVAVLIGPKFSRAPEAQTLVHAHAAVSFKEPNLLFQFLAQWVNLKEDMKQLQVAHEKAIELFHNIPNTNQIILDIFLKETQYDNKTIDH